MTAVRRRWAAELLHFWFHRLTPEQRFASDDHVDAELRRRFGRDWQALRGQPAATFLDGPRAALAAVILFDQVPRNAWREDARAFASDRLARGLARAALSRGWDRRLTAAERQFLYMPLQHSEAIADQRRSLILFAPLGQRGGFPFARAHYRMIARFGRFPHRNATLGRASSPAELAAIAAGNAW